MTAPIGEPPSMDEFTDRAESSMSYLNLRRTEASRDDMYVFRGQKNENNIRLEFEEPEETIRERRGAEDTIEEEIWESITYRVIINDNMVRERTYSFDFSYNPSLTWDRQISKFLMTVGGSINGEVRK